MATRPLLLGHRGARSESTILENTPAAFDLALAQGCDGFEFDVRLSADGQALICHDSVAHGLNIAESPEQELALPRLREVLACYESTAFLDIELKVAGLEAITADLLHKHPPRGCVVSSFLPEVIEVMHGLDAGIPLGLICETRVQLGRSPGLPVQYVILHYALVQEDLMAKLKAAHKKIFVWTVNLPADMKHFASWGVDGIISDNPKLLVRTLGPPAQNAQKTP